MKAGLRKPSISPFWLTGNPGRATEAIPCACRSRSAEENDIESLELGASKKSKAILFLWDLAIATWRM
jgi:hypothetical protein